MNHFTDSKGNALLTDATTPILAVPPPARKIWRPLMGIKVEGVRQRGSQELYMACPCHHVLYHGTRGPGKTDAQVMQFRSKVGKGYGAFWRGVIFDRRYKNLDDLISKAKRWFMQFDDGCQFLKSQGDLKFVWPSGEELMFRRFSTEDDYWDHHGQEYPFIGWNELTKYPTPKFYDLMMSCNRSSFLPLRHSPRLTEEDHRTLEEGNYDLELVAARHGAATAEAIGSRTIPEIPLWVRATTNPYGAGHSWVKRRFIDVAGPGVVQRVTTEVFNPRTQTREPVIKTQTHIFGSYMENIYLSPEYIADLENITEENRRRAWLYGDWNITAGGAFDDLWTEHVHVKPRFKVPANWQVFRSFDWGSTHPFSVGFWALADGTEVQLPNGFTFCPTRGSLIRLGEWYGCGKDAQGRLRIGDNVGLKMSATDISHGINYRQRQFKEGGWIATDVAPGPADNQIRAVTESDVDTIEKKMADNGVTWTKSDKSGGSRKIGLQLMRDRLQASLLGEGPGVYFMDNCRAAIAILPTLPRDEDDMDDIDTEAEDHVWDETRYVILSSDIRAAKSLNFKLPT